MEKEYFFKENKPMMYHCCKLIMLIFLIVHSQIWELFYLISWGNQTLLESV